MKIVPPGVPECVVGRNPPASSHRQHEEPGGSRTASGPQSLYQRPRIWHTTSRLGLLGVPPDLIPDQEGVDVVSVSFLHAQTCLNVNPSHDRLIG
jgi:hypothetical protein